MCLEFTQAVRYRCVSVAKVGPLGPPPVHTQDQGGRGCFAGLPCSAHIWIARGTTLKTLQNPRGDMGQACVRKGNMLACRWALAILVCVAREVYWGYEQPASSVAPFLPYLEWCFNLNASMHGFQPAAMVKLTLS